MSEVTVSLLHGPSISVWWRGKGRASQLVGLWPGARGELHPLDTWLQRLRWPFPLQAAYPIAMVTHEEHLRAQHEPATRGGAGRLARLC